MLGRAAPASMPATRLPATGLPPSLSAGLATARPRPARVDDARPAGERAGRTTDRAAAARVGLLGLVHFGNDAYACVLTALLPVLLPALGLTIGAGGVLTALYQVVSAILQPIIGYVSDRRRLHWPIWAGLMLTTVGGSFVGLAPSFTILALCVVVASVGTSLLHPVAAATVGRLAPPAARGRWMGLYETAGWAGTVVGPLAVGLTVERFGPGGIWPAVLPALALALVMIRLTPRLPDAATGSGAAAPGTVDGRSRLGFLGLFTTVGSLRSWVYCATALFLPLLGSEIGLGASGSAHLLTVFLAAGALGSLASGAASDRLGPRWVIAGALTLTIPLGAGLLIVTPGGIGLFALAATTGFLLTGVYTGLTVAGQQRLPGDAGMVTGLNVGLTSGIGGLAVVPLAALADDIGLRTALALALTVGPLLALAVWLLAGRAPRLAETPRLDSGWPCRPVSGTSAAPAIAPARPVARD